MSVERQRLDTAAERCRENVTASAVSAVHTTRIIIVQYNGYLEKLYRRTLTLPNNIAIHTSADW